MKSTKIIYWVFTVLMLAIMGLGSIPNIMSTPESVELFKHLQYPLYIIPFIGIAKLAGSIGILIPGLNRLKEWAYAGFVIDLTGAMYSMISVGDPFSGWVFFPIALGIIAGSYIYHHKRLAEQSLAKS